MACFEYLSSTTTERKKVMTPNILEELNAALSATGIPAILEFAEVNEETDEFFGELTPSEMRLMGFIQDLVKRTEEAKGELERISELDETTQGNIRLAQKNIAAMIAAIGGAHTILSASVALRHDRPKSGELKLCIGGKIYHHECPACSSDMEFDPEDMGDIFSMIRARRGMAA